MVSIYLDIIKFNDHIKELVQQLHARGGTTHDLLLNLFKAYKVIKDKEFTKYINDKKNEYNEGKDINPSQLMLLASNKFKTMKQDDEWNAPSEEQEQIMALQAQVKKACASVAVPIGSSALDENACRSKHRTTAQSFMKGKPIRYAIRFYANVGSKHLYLHSLWDNGSGNTEPSSPAERFTKLFSEMRMPFNKTFQNDPKGKVTKVAKDSASALWTLQMVHQMKKKKDPKGKRNFFTDNYYTRHVLANMTKTMSDGEARLTGTVKYNLIDSVNRPMVDKAAKMVSKMERSSWVLVQAYDESSKDTSKTGRSASTGGHGRGHQGHGQERG